MAPVARRRDRLGAEALLRDHLNERAVAKLVHGAGDGACALALVGASRARRATPAHRQRLRPADDGPACAGAAVPLAGRVPGLRLAGQPRRAVPARAGARGVVAARSTPRPGASSCARAWCSTTARRSPPTTRCSRSQRAMTPPSQRSFQLKGVTAAKKVDELTLEIQLEAPDAVLPEKLISLPMMSKAWSQAHKVEIAQDFNGKQETFAVRNANGTGPFHARPLRARRAHRAEAQPALVGLERQALGQRRRGRLAGDPLRRDPAGGAGLGRGRPGARPADSRRRAAEERGALDA